MINQITLAWQLSQPPQIVWQYFTEPKLLEQWLGPTDFEPVAGHHFRFVSPYGNDCICEVLEIKPFESLSYSWQKNSAKDDLPYQSTVEWLLVPMETGTTLYLSHYGFRAAENVTPHEAGWSAAVKQLEELITA